MNRRNPILLHIFFWFLFTSCFIASLYIDEKRIDINLFIRIAIGITVFYINYILLVPLLLFQKKKMFYFLGVITLLVISFYVFRFIEPKKIPLFNSGFPPPDFRGPVLDRIRGGPPKFIIVLFTLVFIILGTITQLYQKLMHDDKTREKIESQKNKTELEVLKNQLNPHFLFNTLNSIYSLSVKKSDDTPEAIIMLAELMRYMLYKANNKLVLLKDELENIENYIRLQRLRVASNDTIKISIRGNVSNQKISPLLFISYIENAFKYGTDYSGNTEVTIAINVTENKLQFNCTNLIGSRPKHEEDSGIGMKNTRERLVLLYPNKHWLDFKEENNKFSIRLTLQLN